MEEPKFGFVRRDEEKDKIKEKLNDKSKDYGKIFSLIFLIIFVIPLVFEMFIFSLIPMFIHNNIPDDRTYIETYAYKNKDCSFFGRDCEYYYEVNGDRFIYDKEELGFNFKKIKIYYEEVNPHINIKSNHNNVYYFLTLIPFVVVFIIIFCLHNAIVKANKTYKVR